MKIGLRSDYKDFYDHAFYPAAVADKVWERNQYGGMSRRDMFPYLQQCGFDTPIYGPVASVAPTLLKLIRDDMGFEDKALIQDTSMLLGSTEEALRKEQQNRQVDIAARQVQQETFDNFTKVVVYIDELAHRGEGKILLPAAEALAKYPNHYCTQYVPTDVTGKGSNSERMLTIGGVGFIIQYASSDWRSNHGDGVRTAVTHRFPMTPKFLTSSPIFAIDFVRNGKQFLAIDYNEAPGLDVVKEYVQPTEIYDIVEKFLSTPSA